MKMFIERVELSNYRSCKKTTFKPDPSLSALIGINGSGKTNLLQGLLLLKKITRVPRPHMESTFPLSGCRLSVTFNLGGRALPYKALIKYSTNERNVDEVAGATQKWNFQAFTGHDAWLALPMLQRLEAFYFPRYVRHLPPNQRSLWLDHYSTIVGQRIESEAMLHQISALVAKVYDFVSGITYYGASQFTDPSRCPASFEIESGRPYRRFQSDTGEHTQFMYDLYTAFKENKSEYEYFKSIVGPDGIGLVDSMNYVEIDVPSSSYEVFAGGNVVRQEIKKLLVVPNFLVKATNLSPNQLSEGTFKTLAVVFYLITDKSRFLLLEEPEVCVHHGLLASIIEIIKAFSRRKQIVISTHSDYVLDALKPHNVFVVTADSERGTRVKSVPSSLTANDYHALKQYLDEAGNLGEYWRHGELER